MGQYYLTINLDKKQFLHPHELLNGLKLLEFSTSDIGLTTALSLLLAEGNGQGEGDMRPTISANHTKRQEAFDFIGSWAGDRIVVAGDYCKHGKYLTKKQIDECLQFWRKESVQKLQLAKKKRFKLSDTDKNFYRKCEELGRCCSYHENRIERIDSGKEEVNIFKYAECFYFNISAFALRMICLDEEIEGMIVEIFAKNYHWGQKTPDFLRKKIKKYKAQQSA